MRRGNGMRRRGSALACRYGHAARGGTGSHVQALLFPRDRFTVATAKEWSARHDWKTDDVDVTDDYIHLRQEDPSHFKRIRTVFMGGRGVEARVGWKK